MEKKFQTQIQGKDIEVKINDWAIQAYGSCLVKLGETEVLATAVMAEKKDIEQDFFPLTVEYEEKFYAAGKIFGSRFVRREGRPTDEAILTGRMIDRAIRPRFAEEFKKDTQVIVSCLSWDGKNDPDVLGLIAASTALSISNIPFMGPVGVIRVGRVNGEFVFNPTYEERVNGDMDLLLAGILKNGKVLINMIEMGAKEVSEEDIMKAAKASEPELKKIIEFQSSIAKEIGKDKFVVESFSDAEVETFTKDFAKQNLEKAVKALPLIEKDLSTIDALQAKLSEMLTEKFIEPKKIQLGLAIFEKEIAKTVYENIIKNNQRPDGRKRDQLRKISCEVGVLTRTHGSGVFYRGLTHVLSVLTLGGPKDQQLLEGMEFIGKKRFMHHYNFPPYSTGEVSGMRGPKRREIGHGALVEKALLPVIPDADKFPYTIRIVSECVSSNGSTSMASVCAASLSLMDAGVPIKEVVAGISIGFAEHEDMSKQKLMVDIQGPEDHFGGMDFKVAGTKNGVTAIQMDTKTDGIDHDMMTEALSLAKGARAEILGIIKKTIPEPRKNLSAYAPKIRIIQINPSKIGEVVGSKGSVINKLIEKYKVSIDIEDSGQVFITGEDDKMMEGVVEEIKGIVRDVEVGEVFQGTVVRITDFGAFVEILPGTDGLVHISKFVSQRLKSVTEVVKVGDVIPVKVMEIDEMGRINLSAMAAGFKPKN